MKQVCNKCNLEYEEKSRWYFDPGHFYPESEDGKPFALCQECLREGLKSLGYLQETV